MLTLSVIALASGLALSPAPAGSYTTASMDRYERARMTLNQMTSEAQSRLRDKNIEEALNSGIRTFRMALNEQMGVQMTQEIAAAPIPESHQSVTVK